MFTLKSKIFPLIVLLLATTFNSFSGLKKCILSELLTVSAKNSTSSQTKGTDSETPQNTEEQENDDKDDKVEDADDLFLVEHLAQIFINHQVNHIYSFQVAIYHEYHLVIFSPPPEA